jgi:periplasmic divalent cation tolerance protein
MSEAIVVLCTAPLEFDAEGLARNLVERSLAACVQIGPAVSSVYRWQGAVERSEERLLLIKSRRELFGAIEEAIKALHPYDVPEIIALEVSAGHAPYLQWLNAATTAREVISPEPGNRAG